jgi:hypothetical protein
MNMSLIENNNMKKIVKRIEEDIDVDVESVKDILKEYCENDFLPFHTIQSNIEKLFGVDSIVKLQEVKNVFIETMCVCRENNWSDAEKNIRYTYGGFSIINIITGK